MHHIIQQIAVGRSMLVRGASEFGGQVGVRHSPRVVLSTVPPFADSVIVVLKHVSKECLTSTRVMQGARQRISAYPGDGAILFVQDGIVEVEVLKS